jgi:hypothetical protein
MCRRCHEKGSVGEEHALEMRNDSEGKAIIGTSLLGTRKNFQGDS